MNSTITPSPFTEAFTANADEFYSQLYVSVPIGLALILVYCAVRRICVDRCEFRRSAAEEFKLLDDQDQYNDDTHHHNDYPPISTDGLVKWIYDIWTMNSITFYSYAGFDGLVFRLFLIGCFKICLLSLPYSLILLPIYATSANDGQDDWLDILSLNTVPKGSNRLYATVIGCYLFSFITLYYFTNVYLKLAYVADKYMTHSTINDVDLGKVDKLTMFNYNQTSRIHAGYKASVSLQGSLNRNGNAIDLRVDDREEEKQAIDAYPDIHDTQIPCIEHYTVMLRNLPEQLRNEQAFTAFIHEMFDADKIVQIVMIPDVSELFGVNDRIKYHTSELKQLCKKHNLNADAVYNEANLPQVHGRLHCCGLCGTRLNLVLYHRQQKDELIAKFNQLQQELNGTQAPTATAFVIFNSLQDASCFIASSKPLELLKVEIRKAPSPRQMIWENLKYEDRQLVATNLCVLISMVFLLIFWSIPVVAIQGLANIQTVFTAFHADIHQHLSDSTIAYLQGSLTVLILDVWLMSVPIIAGFFSRLQRPTHKGQYQLLILSKYYVCLLFMVLLVTVITSAILNGANDYEDYFKNFVDNIGNIANLLAKGLSNMSIYFLLYILLNAFIWLPLELYKPGYFLSKSNDKEFVFSLWFPKVLLIFTICLTYSVMNPILPIFGLFYFLFAIIVFTYNLSMSWMQTFEIGPTLWTTVFQLIRYSFVISIITNYGLLLLKQAYVCSVLLLPLLVFVWIYSGNLKRKFDTMFNSAPLISAKRKDVIIEGTHIQRLKQQASLYLPPVLRTQHKKPKPYYPLH